jgi:hypothetical protein
VTTNWRKSTRSGTGQGGGGDCVELAALTGTIGIRDSKNPAGPILTIDRAQLGQFFGRIKNDQI